MIQTRTMLDVTDNSGAKVIQCIKVLGGTKRRYAFLGDIIVGTVKKAEPRKIVGEHEIVRAVIVRQKNAYRRADGTYIRFGDNAVVVLEGKTKKPRGGRIFGPMAREIKEKGFDGVVAIAEELV